MSRFVGTFIDASYCESFTRATHRRGEAGLWHQQICVLCLKEHSIMLGHGLSDFVVCSDCIERPESFDRLRRLREDGCFFIPAVINGDRSVYESGASRVRESHL